MWDIPSELIPQEAKKPNSLLWITFRFEKRGIEFIKIEARDIKDNTPMC